MVLTPLLSVLCGAQLAAEPVSVDYKLTPREVVAARVAAATMKNSERGAKLRELFAEAGCPPDRLELQPVKRSKAPNVICTIPGKIEATIVVGAHFDHTEVGLGVIDDWSGAALLPALLESVRHVDRRHTFVFIGFTDEERGLVGSRHYVKALGKDGVKRISAMIDFDSIGAGPMEVENKSADKALLRRLVDVVAAMKLPLKYVNLNRVGTSDFFSFRAKGAPTLVFHSLTQENLKLLHSPNDNMNALKMDDYYDTYRTAAVYLAYLDLMLDAPTPSN